MCVCVYMSMWVHACAVMCKCVYIHLHIYIHASHEWRVPKIDVRVAALYDCRVSVVCAHVYVGKSVCVHVCMCLYIFTCIQYTIYTYESSMASARNRCTRCCATRLLTACGVCMCVYVDVGRSVCVHVYTSVYTFACIHTRESRMESAQNRCTCCCAT